MKLNCPGCGAVVASEDININSGIAKCRACDEVIDVKQALGLASAGVAGERKLVARPQKLVVDETGLYWTVRWRWFDASAFFLLFFCIAWDAFLVFWYSIAFSTDAPWIMKVFPIAHVAVGLGLTYLVAAMFLNTTTLSLEATALCVRHAPLPWKGNIEIPIADIQQLFCKRTVSRTTDDDGTATRSSQFALAAVMMDGREVQVVTVKSLGEALFLEQEIEARLGIKPMPVAGECLAE